MKKEPGNMKTEPGNMRTEPGNMKTEPGNMRTEPANNSSNPATNHCFNAIRYLPILAGLVFAAFTLISKVHKVMLINLS